jgi:maltose-binding protein MalE
MDIPENYGRRKTLTRLGIGLGIMLLLVLGISSCNLPNLEEIISSNPPTVVPNDIQASSTPAPTPTQEATSPLSQTMILWVPPQFDPRNGTVDGNMFLSRLDEFSTRRPQIDIQIRVKELAGEHGLIESLRTTKAAAPVIVPDVIALPRFLMEEAAKEGLILPLDDLTDVMEGDDWYAYAKDLSLIEETVHGIPFAGDLMVLAYKNDADLIPPADWDSIIKFQKAMTFPASDPRALVTLAHYQSLGVDLIDENGEFSLQSEPLLEVLTYYQQSQVANVMPYWLTQFETDIQSWQSYQDRQSTLALTWSSTLFASESANTSLAAMPTKEGKAFAYADGWVWCVIPSNLGTEQVALELIEFITEDDYISDWSIEAGYLPVRPSGLDNWGGESYFSTLGQLLPTAVLIPGRYQLHEFGTDIRDAVVAVLKDQIEPTIVVSDLLGVELEP